MRAIVLSRLSGYHHGPLADTEFRDRLKRLPDTGRRLLFWVLEQQEIEQEIQADDDLSRNQMRERITESRRRPVKPLSDLELTAIREALDDGGFSAWTIARISNAALDEYFGIATKRPAPDNPMEKVARMRGLPWP